MDDLVEVIIFSKPLELKIFSPTYNVVSFFQHCAS